MARTAATSSVFLEILMAAPYDLTSGRRAEKQKRRKEAESELDLCLATAFYGFSFSFGLTT